MYNDINDIAKTIGKKVADFNYVERIVKDKNNYIEFEGVKINPYGRLTLSHGIPSLCMLYGELNEQYPEEGWDVIGHKYMQLIGQSLEKEGINNLSMFSGMSGIGLASVCISKNRERYSSFISSINNFLFDNVNTYIDEIKKNYYLKPGCYDAIEGISGIASYCMLFPEDEHMLLLLKKIVTLIIEVCKDKKFENITVPGWYIPKENLFSKIDREVWPKGCFNMGLAHGVPALLIILSNSFKLGIHIEGQIKCIRNIADFLIKFRIENDKEFYWGANISIDEYINGSANIPLYTRDAWCYGAPGVCYSLITAGNALKDKVYMDYAIKGMKYAALRHTRNYSPIFCHGFAGISYITYRFYQMTKVDEFKTAYTELSNKVLSFYNSNLPFGFRNIEKLEDKDHFYNNVGLIDGTVGILLSLLAMHKGKKTPWDCAFLLQDI